jgi:hypothetical protein
MGWTKWLVDGCGSFGCGYRDCDQYFLTRCNLMVLNSHATMMRLRSCPYILQLPGHLQLASSLVLAINQETTMTAAENDMDQLFYSPVAYISAREAADWLKREV